MNTAMADFYRQTYFTLESLRMALDLEHEQWSEMLGLSNREYLKIYLQAGKLHPRHVAHVAELLNLTLGSIIFGEIDLVAVRAHFHGNKNFIPEKYTIGAFSKMRTVASMITYIDNTFGHELGSKILKELQITRAALSDHDRLVSINLGTDVLARIHARGARPQHFIEIGAESVEQNKSGPVGKLLKSTGTPNELYERMIENVSLYEKNCTYKILRHSATSCTIESVTKPEAAEALKRRHLGSPQGCIFKAGILSATPAYINLPRAFVQETHCVFRGDPACIFEVNFESSMRRAHHEQNDQPNQAASSILRMPGIVPKQSRSSHIVVNL